VVERLDVQCIGGNPSLSSASLIDVVSKLRGPLNIVVGVS